MKMMDLKSLEIVVAKHVGKTILKVVGAGLIIGGAYILGYTKGNDVAKEQAYQIQKDISANQTNICEKVIGLLQEEMRQNCNRENFENGDVLHSISTRKDQILEQYDCSPQEWQCKPNEPSDLEKGFKVEFRYK